MTRGAHKWIQLHRWKRPQEAIASLQARGFRVYATLPGSTFSIEDVDVSTPIAVAFGNEHSGLGDDAIAACDGAIGVPMFGFTESFNLSVTVGLAMSRIATRRRAHLGATGDLDDATKRHLRARWFALKVKGVLQVLDRVFPAAAT